MTVKRADSVAGKSTVQVKHYAFTKNDQLDLHRGIHPGAVPNENDEEL